MTYGQTRLMAGAAMIALTCTSSMTFAQAVSQANDADQDDYTIVVTAQKREQTLQEVPISVQVVTGDMLRRNDLNDLSSLSDTLPAVTITDNGVAQYLYIRGVGSGENSGFEQSVGTFIDGVYIGRGRSSRQQQLDLAQIEVLRGPQSIFFGNSAIAGAFNIKTADPGSTWEGYANAQYEVELDGREFEAAIGGPVSDTLGVRFAGRYAKTDGWVTNIIDDSTAPASESYAFRGTVQFKATDTLDVVLKSSYAHNQSYGTPYEALKCPPLTGAPGLPCLLNLVDPAGNTIPLDFRKVSGNQQVTPILPNSPATPVFPDENFRQKSWLTTLNMDWDVGAGVISSTTGYLKTREPNVYDPDQTRYFLINVDSEERFKQISQELRFASNEDGPVQYTAGAYLHHSKLDLDGHGRFNIGLPAAVGPFPAGTPIQTDSRTITEQTEDLFSFFAQLRYELTNSLGLSLGGRFVQVDKDIELIVRYDNLENTGPSDPVAQLVVANLQNAIPGTYTSKLSNNKFTPEVVLDYKVNPDINVYAKYTEGFKAGGFDGGFNGSLITSDNPPGFRFNPETVEAYEVGVKTSFANNRIILNLAAFRSEYSDLQVAIFDAVSTETIVKNVGASVSQGIEFEGTFRPVSGLTINTAFTLLDAKYKDFAVAPCTAEQKAGVVPGCVGGSQNLTGADLQFSPDFSGYASVTYETPIGSEFLVRANVQGNYSDAYYTTLDNDPDFRVPSNVHISARLSFGDIDDRWSVGVLGKNLTDQDNFTAGINWPLATGSKLVTRERPRTIAVFANYKL